MGTIAGRGNTSQKCYTPSATLQEHGRKRAAVIQPVTWMSPRLSNAEVEAKSRFMLIFFLSFLNTFLLFQPTSVDLGNTAKERASGPGSPNFRTRVSHS